MNVLEYYLNDSMFNQMAFNRGLKNKKKWIITYCVNRGQKPNKLFAISTEKRYFWQKITSMIKQEEITLSQWIENLQSHGRNAFFIKSTRNRTTWVH